MLKKIHIKEFREAIQDYKNHGQNMITNLGCFICFRFSIKDSEIFNCRDDKRVMILTLDRHVDINLGWKV
jgi:hypothetical protein